VTALFGVRPWLASVAGIVALSVTAPAFVLISVDEEVRWGHEAQAAMRKQAPLVSDPAIGRYVTSVGHRLASRVSGPKYPYSFTVGDYAELNALALPGGHIWINRGSLKAARNESQLAGVLAHEVAHVALRHAARQISNAAVARQSGIAERAARQRRRRDHLRRRREDDDNRCVSGVLSGG
jgi:predicted Zn-dependent protease